MFSVCRIGGLIRVLPQDTDAFCDMTRPVAPGGMGLVACTLGHTEAG
jgi:hypothetical protein